MKRSVCSVLILFLLLCPVAADAQEFGENGFESLPLSPEFEEISALESEILTQANQIAAGEFGQGDAFFSPEDIGWDEAYKLYYECNPYELGTDRADEVLALLSEEGNGLWEIPLSNEGRSLLVGIAVRSAPTDEARDALTPEEFARLEQQAGRWSICRIGVRGESEDYQAKVDALLQSQGVAPGCQKVLLQAFSKMRSPVALTIRDGRMESVAVFQEPWVLGTSKPFVFGSAKSSNIKEGAVLPFEQMCEIMEQMDPPSDCFSAVPTQPLIIGVLSGAALLVALAIWLIWKFTRRTGN